MQPPPAAGEVPTLGAAPTRSAIPGRSQARSSTMRIGAMTLTRKRWAPIGQTTICSTIWPAT